MTDWVDIDNPNPGPGEMSTVAQGQAKGGTAITRGEGAWFGNDRAYFISTSGGPVGEGQVFEYDPPAGRAQRAVRLPVRRRSTPPTT